MTFSFIDNKKITDVIFVLLGIVSTVFLCLALLFYLEISLVFLLVLIFCFIFLLLDGKLSFKNIIFLLLYLIVFFSPFGAAFLSVELGFFHLFPFRFFLLLLWFVFLITVFLKRAKIDISQIKVKNYLIFFIFWLAWAFLSLTWAEDKELAIRNIIFLFMGCSLIFFCIFYLKQLKDLKRVYYLWIFAFIVLAIIGLGERFTGDHLTISKLYGADRPHLQFIPTATFHNQNDFASYLVLIFPFLLAFFRHKKRILTRLLFGTLIFFNLYLLLFTYSRVNYLALISILLFLFLFLLKIKKKFKIIAVLTLLFLIVLTVFPAHFFQTKEFFIERFSPLISQMELGYGSGGIRVNLIKNSLFCVSRSFGLGAGAGNIDYCIENYGPHWVRGTTSVHNWWFELLGNYGIFIFMAYIFLYINLIWFFYKNNKKLETVLKRKNDVQIRFEKILCEAFLLSLIGFFLASIAPSSIMAFLPQWVLFAFSLAFLNYTRIKNNLS